MPAEPAAPGLHSPDSLARLTARRADYSRYFPFAAIMLLAAVMAGLALLFVSEDRALQRDALHRDVDSLAQSLNLRLQTISEGGVRLAREVAPGQIAERRFAVVAQELLAARPEVMQVAVIDDGGRVLWALAPANAPPEANRSGPQQVEAAPLRAAIGRARETYASFFTAPYATDRVPYGATAPGPFTDLVVPIFLEDRWFGVVLVRVAMPELLMQVAPPDLLQRYRLALVDARGEPLAATSASAIAADALQYAAPVPMLPDRIELSGASFKLRSPLAGNALVWIIGVLTLSLMGMLVALARRDIRQVKVDRALRAETAFRRAMEDSLATGLRVIDRAAVIRHVNPAFCQMTGWSREELEGCAPPFPYWPPGHAGDHRAKLARVLAGDVPAGGFEVKVMRKNGTLFDARMYVSPLLGDDGEQLGWMTSMADVTEPKRISEQLAAAHERFTKVLESLEAAVSVVAPEDAADALLFANRSYRELYGADPTGHRRLLVGLHAETGSAALAGEAQDPDSGRWFDVRVRELRWVDGRAVRLQVATDITERKATEDIVRQQTEKVQLTARLMTMGEMASSLAHELNQPLTAISNYSLGTVARLQAGTMREEDLLPALEKTAAQAQRAGNIVRRIREFVKRAEPRRRPTLAARVLDDAMSFAEIEAQKKRIEIRPDIEPGLPPLMIDPILIEQLLLNLLKNAIDAMDHALVRRIDVQVRRLPGAEHMAEFAVIDHGAGIPPEHVASLFEPFFSTKSEGMGMGLNICRSIVEFHQGRLTVEPNPAGGTVFRATLPLAHGDELDENARHSNERTHRA